MIHYHGGPITPEVAALRVWRGGHGFVSFAAPQQIHLAAGVCQSFALDNGAFSFWKAGKQTDWNGYYEWCREWLYHPACDFAVIPDVIDGDEQANNKLLAAWPFRKDRGVPVWHMHEPLHRLIWLCREYPKVAIGSSGQYATVGDSRWWNRIAEVLPFIMLEDSGRPFARLHGLRMLDPDVFTRLPFHSADSTNVARNIGMDGAWKGTYTPSNKETRAVVIAERIEQHQAADRWIPVGVQKEFAA